jgi:hypothetical protein
MSASASASPAATRSNRTKIHRSNDPITNHNSARCAIKKQSEIKIDDGIYLKPESTSPAWPSSPSLPLRYPPPPTRSRRGAARSDPGRRRRPHSQPAAMAYGDRVTTFEDSEKESEYGYVRKVRASSSPPARIASV